MLHQDTAESEKALKKEDTTLRQEWNIFLGITSPEEHLPVH